MLKDTLITILTTSASVVVLFIITKLVGNKQMSQLNLFDYINGITIGSIAAEMATSLEEFHKPLAAMIVYALFSLAISYTATKSIKMRRILNGKPLILYENGKIYETNLLHAKLDVNEFLAECRALGFFNLAEIDTAILEANGKISVMPLASSRPVKPSDISLSVNPEKPVANVIMDGNIMYKNLQHTGYEEKWLRNRLKEQGVRELEDVFLATVDNNGNLSVYTKLGYRVKKDIFI